ncbi:MAG TPA: hypothetical protein PKL99_11260 [Syntrophales bacterium]|nr:hypothetical protein [Syntrophales bacterium]
MSDVDALKILKWVLIVLIAGFIGQFGKMLASHLIAEARNKRRNRTNREPERPSPGTDAPPAAPAETGDQGKGEPVRKDDPSLESAEERKAESKARKKELKAEAKMKKKEAKEKEKNDS